jgi:predicted Zn-dependent peptidase
MPPSVSVDVDRSASTTLANGLRVFAVQDPTVPAAAVNIWYRVGSRDEVAGRTGLAHLFEHLMFQGSEHVPAGDHAGLLLDCGGTFNATTSFERTNYFETVPTGALRLALWLEADRMATLPQALTQTNLDNQRDVVRNERRERYDNVPYGTAVERLVTHLFGPDHPYGHLPIGSMDDLAAASREDVIAFFHRQYAPGNAVLTAVGDLEAERALDLCAEFFESVPARPDVTGTVDPAPVPAPGVRELASVEDVPTDALFVGFAAPAYGTPEHDAARLALDMFANGVDAPMYQRLVRDGLATEASAGLIPLAYGPSMGIVHIEAAHGVPLERIRDVLWREWTTFVDGAGAAERQHARAVALAERGWLDSQATVAGRADAFSEAITLFGDPARALDPPRRLAATTPEQAAAAARDLAVETRHVALTIERKANQR